MSREMINSGFQWLGMIPKEWAVERLQWHLREINEKNNPVKTDFVLSLTKDRGVIPYEQKGAQGNISKENHSEYKLAFPDTIVANSMNVIIGSVGYCNYFGCVSPVYYVFKNNGENDLRFFNYLFQTTPFQKLLRNYANGILEIRLRLSAMDILKRMIAVPSYDEQRRIADFLDSKCYQIDEISKKIHEEIDTLEEYKDSVITEAVTNGLDPSIEMKDSGVEWIGEIPESWSINRVANIFCERNEPGENDLPFLSVSINSGISDKELSEEETNRQFIRAEAHKNKKVYPGDIVYNMMRAWQGAIGAVRTEGMVSSAYVTAKPMQKIDTRYFEYLLRTPTAIQEMNKYSYGIMDFRKRLYWPYFKNISLCVPPLIEQVAIANYADEINQTIDAFVSLKKEQLSVLEEYKKSLIYEYVTGKKEVAYA